ncbi:MAG: hypothetical protein Q8Q92_04020 [bacterium]|nr:hypothetical protein [bacterium]
MKDQKDHLNIDLEFLDKKDSVRVVPKPESNAGQTSSTPKTPATDTKYNWKNILIIGGIVLFIGWAIFLDDGSSSNSTTNTYIPPVGSQTSNSSDDDVMVGQYSCSRYNYNKAVALDPDETEQQIDSASTAFEYRTNAMKRLKDEIDNSYANDYSEQWEIDDYNAKVDDYNSKLPAYKRDLAILDSRIDQYNAQIQTHNNYLVANCTKRY